MIQTEFTDFVRSGATICNTSLKAESKWTAPNDPVFAAQRNGQPINGDNILRRKVQPALLKLGLSLGIDLHSLRHFTNTQADKYGMSQGERERFLGQAGRGVNARYTHAEIEHARPVFDMIGDLFASALTRKPAGNVIEIKKARRAVG
jgi:hypothetical protein